jgi:hypothetical protein
MDPYLETPRYWLDFHNAVAADIRSALNAALEPRYAAWLTSKTVYETLEIAQVRQIEPDVSVWQPQPPRKGSSAVATIAPAPIESAIPMEVPVTLWRVEIRLVANEQLVTVIEILPPSNKRPSHPGYRQYDRKRRALLDSPVHLLEIDLLRGGERRPLQPPVPPAPYYVILSRAARRPVVEVWPIQLWDPLPGLPVPLLAPDPDACLDLAAVVQSAYDGGPYRSIIDYGEPPPPPPLSEAEAGWVDAFLRERGLRHQSANP